MSTQYTGFTARLIVCLLSGDPACFINTTSAVLSKGFNLTFSTRFSYCCLSAERQICRSDVGITSEEKLLQKPNK